VKNEIKELHINMEKLENSNKDLELRVKDRQTEYSEELKKKVKGLESKVKQLEDNHKNEVDELKPEICILKSETEKPGDTRMDNIDEASIIVFKELKGRNITVVKSKAENNPSKTVTTSKDEENIVKKNKEATEKPKPNELK
jgi:hypothetical protein